jgi:uncharacterized repeat protein (TIGR01451 family)
MMRLYQLLTNKINNFTLKTAKKEEEMIKKFMSTIGVLVIMCLIPCIALAKPLVNISMKAEMDAVVKEGGKSVTKRVVAKDVTPGTVIFYTVSFRNDGDEKAMNAVIDNPIPPNTGYIAGSAYGENEEGITFSIDKGKTYKKPTMLFYEITDNQGKTIKKVASPDEYTNIRWVIPVIENGKQGTVGFKAIVK